MLSPMSASLLGSRKAGIFKTQTKRSWKRSAAMRGAQRGAADERFGNLSRHGRC